MIESIVVEAQFRDLISKEMAGAIKSTKQFEKQTESLSKAATGAQRGVVEAYQNMGGVAGAVTDEIRSRTDNAIATMIEFGGTADQVARAFDLLANAGATGERGIAQTANALRTLADESEDSDRALQNVSKALDLAAATGLKAEDAGRELGKALKGDVAVLKQFDAGAQAAAKAIESITDPALRSKLILEQLDKTLTRNNSALNKARNRLRAVGVQFQALKASQPGLVQGFKGLGVAVAASGAALTAFGAKSVQTYLAGSAKMRKATAENAKGFKAVKFAIGGIILEALGLRDAFKQGANLFGGLAKVIVKNRTPIAQTLRDLALGAVYAFQAITAPFRGIALVFAVIRDYFNEIINGFSLLQEGALRAVIAISKVKKFAVGLTDLEKRNMAEFSKTIKALQATRAKRPFLGETTNLENMFSKGDEFIKKLEDTFKTPISFFELGDMTNPDKVKAAADALTAAQQAGKQLGGFGGVPTTAAQIASGIAGAQPAGVVSSGMQALTTGADAARSETADLGSDMVNLNSVMTDLARGGIAAVGNGLAYVVEQAAAGTLSMRGLGQALLGALGDLSVQAGQAFLLLGTGIQAIQSGDISGAGAIAAGVGLIALGAALKGAASRLGGGGTPAGGGDGQTARAIDRFGRRLFDRPMEDGGRTVMISIDGREMRGFVLETAAAGMYRGQLRPMR